MLEGATSGSDYLTGGDLNESTTSPTAGISHCRVDDANASVSLRYIENDPEHTFDETKDGWIRVVGSVDFGPSDQTLTVYRDVETTLVRSSLMAPIWINDDITVIRIKASGTPGLIVECFQDALIDGLGDSLQVCWLACPEPE